MPPFRTSLNRSKKSKKSESKEEIEARELAAKQELAGLVSEQMAEQMAKLVPDLISQLQAFQNSPKSSVDSKVEGPKPTFLFKQFIACKPQEFTGNDGATALLTWFEAMELAFRRSGCPDELRTSNATGMFRSRAHDWWTSERSTRGDDEAHALPTS